MARLWRAQWLVLFLVSDRATAVVPLSRRPGAGTKVSLIVLTVAHKDHDVTHNKDDNLAAWCQYHHLMWDRDLHRDHARENRRRQREEHALGVQLSLW